MTTHFPLTVVVITRDEEVNIARCTEAVSWCDEVIVIDDGSTDRTQAIAESLGAQVIDHRFESFAQQRNFALETLPIRNEWVLMLDADEVMTPQLRRELEATLPRADRDVVGYQLCRKTMLMGSWLQYSDGYPVWIMRLVRRDGPRFVDQGHGEVAVPQVDGELPRLNEPFLHFPFSHGIGHWVKRHVEYAAREAALERSQHSDWRWSQLFCSDRAERRRTLRALSRQLPCRPLLRFLYQYVLKRGFLDGRGGFTFSLLMAFYEWLTVLQKSEGNRLEPSNQDSS